VHGAGLWFIVAAATAACVWALLRLRVVARVGSGYKAKVLCTALFASRRDLDPQYADEIYADSYWILRPFRAQIDHERETVTASFLGWIPRTAVHRAGFGATLVCDRRQGPVALAQGPAVQRTSADWRVSTGTNPLLGVVDRAFAEPDPARLRRTHAVLIVHDGRIVAERYARGVGADTPLPGWSMAKSVWGALVGVLVDEGRLSLQDRELMPGWRAPDPRAAITLEDLLRMRSGLRFSENYAFPWSDVLHMLFNCADAAAYAASLPLTAPPGRVWSYASGTSNIVSAIVRRVVGDGAYGAWPARVLFDRIGMRSAVLEPDASGTFVASSYMLATARDWARFGQVWLDEGRFNGDAIVSPDWVRACTTPTAQSPEGRFGAHWWLKLNPEIGGDSPAARDIPADASHAVGHEGQMLTVIPSRRLVVVRLGASIYIDAWNHAQFVSDILSKGV
jgi:CubicO group peptidase (beta-lactamase class C family)